MERNGLSNRKRETKVGSWVGGITAFLFISFFLVPWYLPTDSVPPLSGRANMFDYATEDSWGNVQVKETSGVGHNQSAYGTFAWTELDPYAAFIYAFGDLNCHTKSERSWVINGNQMPVCVRDVGIFLGMAIGGFIFSRRGVNRWTIRDTFLSMLPDNKLESIYRKDNRMKAMFVIAAISAVPMAIDGFTQMFTSYESTAALRLITGTPFGLFVGAYIASAFASKPQQFNRDPTMVELPNGTRFGYKEESEQE